MLPAALATMGKSAVNRLLNRASVKELVRRLSAQTDILLLFL
jgi:hypothetical protein